MKEKQKNLRTPVNPGQLDQKLKTMKQTATTNLDQMQTLVDTQVFSGDEEQKAQKRHQDYSHSYIYKGIQANVNHVNFTAAKLIDKYGKATVTDADRKAQPAYKPIENQPVNTLLSKKSGQEASELAYTKANRNELADLVTVREYNHLFKYNQFIHEYTSKQNSTFKKALKKEAKRGKNQKEKDTIEKRTYARVGYAGLAFLKTYEKKGWFRKKHYTLDGKRLKTKKGGMKPEEYNKMLIEGLCLETDKNQGLDEKTLKENREKKAKVLTMLTKEMLESSIDVSKLTDRYLANNIVEVQQYADKLNAFDLLIEENRWFFYGTDNARTKRDILDPSLMSLIETRIIGVSDILNDFLEEHYRAHCLYRSGRSHYKSKGFLKEGMEKPSADDIRGQQKYREDFLYAFAQSFEIYDSRSLTEKQRQDYEAKIQYERSFLLLDGVDKQLKACYKKEQGGMASPLNDVIKTEMADQETASLKQFNEEKKDFEKNGGAYKNIHVPYEQMADGYEGGLLLYAARESILKYPTSYLYFGPEIDHIYGQMYTSCRMMAELRGRKSALQKKLRQSARVQERRQQENQEWAQHVADCKKRKKKPGKRPASKAGQDPFEYQTKNPNTGFLNGFIAEELKRQAQTEIDAVAKKVAYLQYNQKVCRDTLRLVLMGRKNCGLSDEALENVERYLEDERLSYLSDVDLIDEYDDILDDTIPEAREELRKKENPDAQPLPKQKQVLGTRERAMRIAKMRERQQRKKDTEMAELNYVARPRNTARMMADICCMKPGELTSFNFKTHIPVSGKGSANNIYRYLLCSMAFEVMTGHHQQIYKADLSDEGFMMRRLNTYKGNDLVPQNLTLDTFMQTAQLNFEILSGQYYKMASLYKLQKQETFPYLDIDRISELSLEEIGELKKKLEAKQKAETDAAAAVNEKYTKRRHQSKADRAAELLDLVKTYELGIIKSGKYTDLTSEVYSHKLRERVLKARVARAKKEEFFDADENYIQLKDILDSEEVSNLRYTWLTRDEEQKADASEKSTLELLQKQVLRLSEIPTGVQMTELLKSLTNKGGVIRPEPIKKLLAYSTIITSLDEALHREGIEGFPVQPRYLQMREILNKPEHAALKLEIETRLTALKPLHKACQFFLQQYGFNRGLIGTAGREYRPDNARGNQQALLSELNQATSEKNRYLNRLEANLKVLEQGSPSQIMQDYKQKLFERIYQSGEKLSLSQEKKWKAKVEKMSKEGFHFFRKESPLDTWVRLAAKNMLEDWPYSFEEFLSKRIVMDTGKAVQIQLERVGGKEAKDLIDGTNAAAISQAITEVEIDTFQALDTDAKKNLDRALQANGYDPKLFYYLMQPVKVNGAGMPADPADEFARQENLDLAKAFREKASSPEAWEGAVMQLMNEVTQFEITEQMLDEEYISKNFSSLYRMTRKFAAAKEIYEKEKALLHSDKVNEWILNPKQFYTSLHNCFEIQKNFLFGKFIALVEAYAKKHLVNEHGVLDCGLSNAEMGAPNLDLEQENEKRVIQDLTKEQQAANLTKIRQKISNQQTAFALEKEALGIELRREELARQTRRLENANAALHAIDITGQDKIFKLAQKLGFAGNIDDVNILLQTDYIAGLSDQLVDAQNKFAENRILIQRLTKQILDRQQKKKPVPEDYTVTLAKKQLENSTLEETMRQIKEKLTTYQMVNTVIYSSFNLTRDEKGKLVSEKQGEGDGAPTSTLPSFCYFHSHMASDMRKAYEAFKTRLEENKKTNGRLFDRNALAQRMTKPEWSKELRDCKKLNLYLGILEQDRETILQKLPDKKGKLPQPSAFLAEIRKQIGQADQDLKNYDAQHGKPKKDVFDRERNELILHCNDLVDAQFMLETAIKDEETIAELHRYVNLINAVMAQHGIAPDGKLLENQIEEAAGEKLSEEERYKILHENEERARKIAMGNEGNNQGNNQGNNGK